MLASAADQYACGKRAFGVLKPLVGFDFTSLFVF
jgi:hypothetical protein